MFTQSGVAAAARRLEKGIEHNISMKGVTYKLDLAGNLYDAMSGKSVDEYVY